MPSSLESSTNPQVQRTHGLMLDAARDLLNENGPAAVTHLRVAEASGVARATVYRHWPDRADILVDLLRRGADLQLGPPPDRPPNRRTGGRTPPHVRCVPQRRQRADPGRDDRPRRNGTRTCSPRSNG